MDEGGANVNGSVCPACGEPGGRSRGRKNGFQMLSCRRCATLYAARDAEGPVQDYDDYYAGQSVDVPAFVGGRLDEIVATFEPYRKENRLLDVGFGAGSFLEAAARAGWKPFGVEVSRSAVENVSGRGFEVFCGEFEEAAYPEGHFDVVIVSEVLEHVPDPRALLRESARVLRPGGLLWATTPHGRGLSARLLGVGWSNVCPPEHLHLFSVASVRRLLAETGFRQVEVATHGVNPFEIIHGLRPRRAARPGGAEADAGGDNFKRVESSYQLNEFLSERPARRLLKTVLNGLLNAGRVGDSLKIRAVK
jgi:2-polyprenyl-3-methyl-5-hydroxy-6-metoxy-1,4-benzoquinol methylase